MNRARVFGKFDSFVFEGDKDGRFIIVEHHDLGGVLKLQDQTDRVVQPHAEGLVPLVQEVIYQLDLEGLLPLAGGELEHIVRDHIVESWLRATRDRLVPDADRGHRLFRELHQKLDRFVPFIHFDISGLEIGDDRAGLVVLDPHGRHRRRGRHQARRFKKLDDEELTDFFHEIVFQDFDVDYLLELPRAEDELARRVRVVEAGGGGLGPSLVLLQQPITNGHVALRCLRQEHPQLDGTGSLLNHQFFGFEKHTWRWQAAIVDPDVAARRDSTLSFEDIARPDDESFVRLQFLIVDDLVLYRAAEAAGRYGVVLPRGTVPGTPVVGREKCAVVGDVPRPHGDNGV